MKTAIDILNEKSRETLSIDSSSTVHDALKVMTQNKIGAILVTEDDKVVGIWTERDLLNNTITPGFDPKTAKVSNFMTTDLQYAAHDTEVVSLLDKFLGMRLRHLLIEKDGEFAGVISTGDVMRAMLLEKNNELAKLNEMVSWEYYENWRWKN